MYLLMQRHCDISKGTLCQQTKRCRPSSFDFKVRDATEVNDRDELRGVNGEVLYRVEVSYSGDSAKWGPSQLHEPRQVRLMAAHPLMHCCAAHRSQ